MNRSRGAGCCWSWPWTQALVALPAAAAARTIRVPVRRVRPGRVRVLLGDQAVAVRLVR